MYTNYIFDLYGTLIDIRTDEWSDKVWDEFAKWLTLRGMKYRQRRFLVSMRNER